MTLVRLLIILCCFSVNAFGAVGLTDLLSRYNDLQLGKTTTGSLYEVTIEHARFQLQQGTVTPVLAGNDTVGVFLAGSGTFLYETVSQDEFTAVRYNAKHADVPVRATTDKIAISGPFKSLLLLATGLPQASGAPAESPATLFAEHRQQFARHKTSAPPAHLMALRTLNAASSRLAIAQIMGDQPYLYLYDDMWSDQETFAVLQRPQARFGAIKDWLFASGLSKQAVGRSSRDVPPANVTLTHLDVALVNTDKDHATLTVEETLVPQRRSLEALRFDLYSDYYFDVTREPRRFNVRSVTDGQGNRLAFSHVAGELLVALAAPAAPGKPLKVRFEIEGNFLYRPQGSNFWELGIEPWFPMVEMQEQAFTFHSVVKVKKPFVPFVSGTTVRREEEGDWNVLETKLEQPVSWVAILAGKYHFDEETRNGVTVRVASFISKNPIAYKKLRNITFAAIDYFPTFLGPFPFAEINVIEKTSDFPYGQAPAGIVFITSEAFNPLRRDVNEWVEGVNMRLAHEIAHQYWGEVVKMPSYEEQWIDEAFAEYSAALFMKNAGRPADYNNALAVWAAEAKDATKMASIPMANRLVSPADPIGRAMARQGLIYAKGAYILAALLARRPDLPHVHEVLPEELSLENGNDERRHRTAQVRHKEGLHRLLREVLLWCRDARAAKALGPRDDRTRPEKLGGSDHASNCARSPASRPGGLCRHTATRSTACSAATDRGSPRERDAARRDDYRPVPVARGPEKP